MFLGAVVDGVLGIDGMVEIIEVAEVEGGVHLYIGHGAVEGERVDGESALGAADDGAGEGLGVDRPALEHVHREPALEGGEACAELLYVPSGDLTALFVHRKLGICVSGDPFELWQSGEPEKLADMVDAHIEQGAASGGLGIDEFLPRVAVDVRASAAAEAVAAHMVDIAEHACVDEPLRGLGFVIVKEAELDMQLPAGARGGVVHGLRVGVGACHRLFAVAVLPRLHDGDRNRHMPVVVQADVYGVDIGVAEHVADVGVAVLYPVSVADVFQTVGQYLAYRRDLGVGDPLVLRKMALADDAAPDKADLDLGHGVLLLFQGGGNPFLKKVVSAPLTPTFPKDFTAGQYQAGNTISQNRAECKGENGFLSVIRQSVRR